MARFVIKDDDSLFKVVSYLMDHLTDIVDPQEITISQYKKRRSLEQNSLYWCWLSFIREHTGTSKEALHIYYKSKFLPFHIEEVNGEDVRIYKSTTDLNVQEFTDYLSEIEDHARDFHNLILPTQEDFDYGRCA